MLFFSHKQTPVYTQAHTEAMIAIGNPCRQMWSVCQRPAEWVGQCAPSSVLGTTLSCFDVCACVCMCVYVCVHCKGGCGCVGGVSETAEGLCNPLTCLWKNTRISLTVAELKAQRTRYSVRESMLTGLTAGYVVLQTQTQAPTTRKSHALTHVSTHN